MPAPLVDKVIEGLVIKVNRCNYGDSKFLFIYLHLDELEFSNAVADNELVQTLLKFICMDPIELQKKCGNSDQRSYRKVLVNNLMELWD